MSVGGVSVSIVWSTPNRAGEGEYDLGFGLTFDVDEFGASTGRAAIAYGESWRSDASVKDFAGIDGAISLDLVKGGVTASESGWEFHVGPGAGVSVQAQASSVFNLRHRKWFSFEDQGVD